MRSVKTIRQLVQNAYGQYRVRVRHHVALEVVLVADCP